jgi:hypothetical protein
MQSEQREKSKGQLKYFNYSTISSTIDSFVAKMDVTYLVYREPFTKKNW